MLYTVCTSVIEPLKNVLLYALSFCVSWMMFMVGYSMFFNVIHKKKFVCPAAGCEQKNKSRSKTQKAPGLKC